MVTILVLVKSKNNGKITFVRKICNLSNSKVRDDEKNHTSLHVLLYIPKIIDLLHD